MRGLKALLIAAALLLPLALLPKANAQVSITIGGPPPMCPYGYYGYAPYACAPYGYYGPGYFYNGIFLGIGPWRNWGYRHGWGRHRFDGGHGGRYNDRDYYRGNDRRGDRGEHYGRDRRDGRGEADRRGNDRHDNGNHGGDHHGDHGGDRH